MTLQANEVEVLEGIVETFLTQGLPFTSLEIANSAKSNGLRVRNHQVAEWMRENVIRIAHDLGALYNTTLIEVQSKRDGYILANLYHHMSYDPDDYLDRSQNPLPMPSTRAPAPTPQSVTNVRAVQAAAAAGAFSTVGGGVHVPAPAVDDEDDEDLPDEVILQHRIATGGSTATTSPSATTKGVQRDIYGRFANDVAASNKKPPHFLQQHRDGHGRFKKD